MSRTEVLIIPSNPLFLPISGNDPRYTQFSEQGWTPIFPYFFLQAITQSILAQILSQPIQSSPTHFSAPGLQHTSSGLPQHPLNHCIPSNSLTTLQQGKVPLQIWPHHTPLHVLLWIPSASYDEGQNTSNGFPGSAPPGIATPILSPFIPLPPPCPTPSAPVRLLSVPQPVYLCFSLVPAFLRCVPSTVPLVLFYLDNFYLPSNLNWNSTASRRHSPTPETRFIILLHSPTVHWMCSSLSLCTWICWFNVLFPIRIWTSLVQDPSLSHSQQCPQCLAHKWWQINFL